MTQPPRTEIELIELVRSSDVRAPEALHRRVEALVAERSSSRGRSSTLGGVFGFGGAALARRVGAVGALAAVTIAVLAIALGGGGGGGSLTVQRATALALSRASAPAPRESSSGSGELVAAVQGVHFPYWEERFGWRSTGQRTDHVAGHAVMTVFYANGSGQRIGYAIVAGTPPRVSGGSVRWSSGNPYRLFADQGAQTVAWLRHGRLCVLSGRGIDAATLVRLASWGQRGSTA